MSCKPYLLSSQYHTQWQGTDRWQKLMWCQQVDSFDHLQGKQWTPNRCWEGLHLWPQPQWTGHLWCTEQLLRTTNRKARANECVITCITQWPQIIALPVGFVVLTVFSIIAHVTIKAAVYGLTLFSSDAKSPALYPVLCFHFTTVKSFFWWLRVPGRQCLWCGRLLAL